MKIKLDEGAIMPTRAHDTDAGLDIYTPTRVVLRARTSETVDTGVHVEIPPGYVGLLKSKSGLMRWDGITSEGTIDAGYSGSIHVTLFNQGDRFIVFRPGEKISQLVVVPCLINEPELVDQIASGDRGENGFGSTGK